MHTVLVALGTRPEAIKLAPVVFALRAQPGVRVVVVNTGQHAEMLDETLASFGIEADHALEIIRPAQPLEELTARALTATAAVIAGEEPDLVVVQGDTTTVFAAALAAFYARVPVAHVEAGLRTGIPDLPFPEEMNRRLAGALAALHFAPTESARDNLLREGVDRRVVFVTGNTVVDALRWMLANSEPPAVLDEVLKDSRRKVVVTAHRRESWGVPMKEIGAALADLAAAEPDVLIVFPIHPNPIVREAIVDRVQGASNVRIIEPLPYAEFVHLLDAAHLLLTDSGGIQEEAAALGKPVLVMREVTERGEGVATGTAELVGRSRERIVAGVRRLLDDEDAYAARTRAGNPYGDGRAAERIAAHVREFLDARA